jgi:hypothetical protein
MATKKKTAKKATRRAAEKGGVGFYLPNLIPLCIQVEQADSPDDKQRPLILSRTGKRFPLFVYWIFQATPDPYIALPGGFFMNQPDNFALPVDPTTGKTDIIQLDPFSTNPAGPGSPLPWRHGRGAGIGNFGRGKSGGAGGSGGGIIIQD